MKTLRTLFLPALLLFSGALTERAGAQWGLRPHRALDQQWEMQQRQLYRPRVHVVRPKGATRTLAPGSTQTVEFSVMRGQVSRIELRSGLKVLQTLRLPPGSRAGRLRIQVPSGPGSFTLWAWQGQPGFQSVHGESIRYSLGR